GLQGLFGVDAILNPEGIWIVEVNPRYTASLEVLERAVRIQTVALHIDACLKKRVAPNTATEPDAVHGKAVLYADRPVTITPGFAEWTQHLNCGYDNPTIADIPMVGTSIAATHPICTVF